MHDDRFRSAQALSRPRAAVAVIAAGLALLTGLLAGQAAPALAHPAGQDGPEGQAIFQAKCAACHTVGQGKLVGPDLKDVTDRRDPAWLQRFIANPDAMFAANDLAAQQLLQEFNGVKMPAAGLSDAEVAAVIQYLATSSPAPASQNAPAAQDQSAGDPVTGRLLFTGEMALNKGGQACIACHNVRGAGGLGGGALGPDLTHVVQRYGEPGLTAALGNIAFPTMVGPFANRPLTPWEQASLVAFLKQADQSQPTATGQSAHVAVGAGAITANTAAFLGIGLVGAIVLMAILFAFWRPQRQSISSRLREKSRRGGV
jgi:cytochrome c2